jgi:hypothetical protein
MIKTKEDLESVGKVLIRLAKSCPEDHVLELFYAVCLRVRIS